MKQLPSKLQSLFAAVGRPEASIFWRTTPPVRASFTVWQEGYSATKKLNTVRSAEDLFFRRWKTSSASA